MGLCTMLLSSYRPSLLASNAHLQTVMGLLRGLTIPSHYNRQIIMSHDGGTLALDWWKSSRRDLSEDTPVLLICHGINGGSHEGYCKWMCHAADAKGWRGCVLNYRGCNGLPLTSGRGYAATMTGDVYLAISSIRALYSKAPLFAVGYSLGGVILTKYLAESDSQLHNDHPSFPSSESSWKPRSPSDQSKSGLLAAAIVSSPICLTNSSFKISSGFNFLYNLALAYKLREYIHLHSIQAIGSGPMDIESSLTKLTVGEIEDAGLPQQFGYNSREEYYQFASSLRYIPSIKTPSLFLLSEDDPFLGVLPDEECSMNPWTLLAVCKRGGHVAFLSGLLPIIGPAWMDNAVLEFFESNIEIDSRRLGSLRSRL
jgi:abhydrolase domain-containing protein 1/3